MTKDVTKEDRINVRLPAETKLVIEMAAHIKGVTVSEFILSAASQAATAIVEGNKVWTTHRDATAAFIDDLMKLPKFKRD